MSVGKDLELTDNIAVETERTMCEPAREHFLCIIARVMTLLKSRLNKVQQ